MPDILILTCGQQIQAEHVASLVNSIINMNERDISYKWGNSQGSLVGYVRNRIWQHARAIDCKKIVWIDSDISWGTSEFNKLISSDKDIVSGLYLDAERKPVGEVFDNQARYLMHDLVRMNYVGMGFLALTRKVIDALPEPFIREGHYGEDVAFCLNARDAGFDVWLDPTIRVSHHKTIAITP